MIFMEEIIKALKLSAVAEYIKTGPPIIMAGVVLVVSLIVLMIISKILKKALSKTTLDISLQKFFVKIKGGVKITPPFFLSP